MPLTALEVQTQAQKIVDNLETVIVGKRRELELVLIGLLCQGHLLIEDVPGVGKTMLARSLAQSLGCTFSRIQFTPDLLPSDVTGSSIFNQQTRQFEFRPGPIMGQIVLADEINRATPKTQSALLEAMEERQITIDGVVHPLPQPFHGHRHAEPDRVRGHVSAARSAARSLSAAREPGVSVEARRDSHDRTISSSHIRSRR